MALFSRKKQDESKAAGGGSSSTSFRYPGSAFGGLSGMFGSDAWLGQILPGSRINWTTEAGQLWKSSLVGACLWYIQDTFAEAPFAIFRPDKEGKEKIVAGHVVSELLKRPNGAAAVGGAAIPGALLWQATVLSLVVDGNAFWLLRRNAADRIVQIQYVPHWMMVARWSPDGTDYVQHYDYTPGSSAMQEIDPRNVIHFRQGQDPENVRMGLSRLKNVLREIVTDNEANTYTAAILKNMGVPGVIITPKVGPGGESVQVAKGFIDRVKKLWKSITGGDNRGDALVFEDPFDVTFPGFTPEQLVLDKIRSTPESRVCGATRVPAIIAQLLVGEQHKTYSNMGEARHQAYETVIMPLQELFADTLDVQLLPQLAAQPGDHCGWDRSQVQCLQEDIDKKYARITKAFDAGLIKRSEGKTELGFPVDETEDDVYITDIVAPVEPEPTVGGDEDPSNGSAPPLDSAPGDNPDKVKALPWRLQAKAIAKIRAQWQKRARERRERYEQEDEA